MPNYIYFLKYVMLPPHLSTYSFLHPYLYQGNCNSSTSWHCDEDRMGNSWERLEPYLRSTQCQRFHPKKLYFRQQPGVEYKVMSWEQIQHTSESFLGNQKQHLLLYQVSSWCVTKCPGKKVNSQANNNKHKEYFQSLFGSIQLFEHDILCNV